MNLLILGRGKTGTLVAAVARERKHHIQIAGAKENEACAALTPETLRDVDVVIDFTAPYGWTCDCEDSTFNPDRPGGCKHRIAARRMAEALRPAARS